jgi:hypothetical protein
VYNQVDPSQPPKLGAGMVGSAGGSTGSDTDDQAQTAWGSARRSASEDGPSYSRMTS